MLKRLLRHPRTQAALAWVLGAYLAFAYRTTRWRLEGAEYFDAHLEGAPVIVAFWHERLPLMPMLWRMARQLPGQKLGGTNVHVLVSQHRDGQFIGNVIRRFDLGTILGSSSRGGASSVKALVTRLRGGDFIAITPDGPRGPAREAAKGVAWLAALAGVPVLPCAARTTRCRRLGSWDRMLIPLPFARGVVCCRPTIQVPREGWEDALPVIAAEIDAAAARADVLCGEAGR